MATIRLRTVATRIPDAISGSAVGRRSRHRIENGPAPKLRSRPTAPRSTRSNPASALRNTVKPTASATLDDMPGPSHSSTRRRVGRDRHRVRREQGRHEAAPGPRRHHQQHRGGDAGQRPDGIARQRLRQRHAARRQQRPPLLPRRAEDRAERRQRVGRQAEAARRRFPRPDQQQRAEQAAPRRAAHGSAPQKTRSRSAPATAA